MKLGIYGAGGLGREVLVLAQTINQQERRWDEIVFIDDIHPNRELKRVAVMALDSAQELMPIEIVIAVGEPAVRAMMAAKVRAAKLPLASLVHPNVDIPPCTSIGKGVVICKGVIISCDICIEDNVYLQPNLLIGHDCRIGESSVVSPGVSLGGHCVVGPRSFIGMNAAVKENTRLGADVIVSMGAAVFSDVQDSVITLGNPARIMRRNENKQVFK